MLRPVGGGVSVCQRCLEVTGDKAMEDGMGHEQDQAQRQDRVGMAMKGMVGMPKRDQFVEPLILDLPSGVTEVNDGGGGGFSSGQGGDPGPVLGPDGVRPPFAFTCAYLGGFERANNADRVLPLRPGGEPLDVPPLRGGGALLDGLRSLLTEEGLRIDEQVATENGP